MRLEQRWVLAFVVDLKPNDHVRLADGKEFYLHHKDARGTLWPIKPRKGMAAWDPFGDEGEPVVSPSGIVAVEINEPHPDHPSDY